MRLRWRAPRDTKQRGSAIVPAVVAMLVLSLCGGALAEAIGAQRIQSVLLVESAQAHWIAESGAWHAALQESAIPGGRPLGSGSYSATKSGTTYTSTGTVAAARRTFEMEHAPGSGGGSTGNPPTDPLDVGATVNSARRNGRTRINIDLVSRSAFPVMIDSFSLEANRSSPEITRIRLDNIDIWRENGGVDLPTGDVDLNMGWPENAMIEAGASPRMRLEFDSRPSGTISYTLVLRYTNGASSTLAFSIRW